MPFLSCFFTFASHWGVGSGIQQRRWLKNRFWVIGRIWQNWAPGDVQSAKHIGTGGSFHVRFGRLLSNSSPRVSVIFSCHGRVNDIVSLHPPLPQDERGKLSCLVGIECQPRRSGWRGVEDKGRQGRTGGWGRGERREECRHGTPTDPSPEAIRRSRRSSHRGWHHGSSEARIDHGSLMSTKVRWSMDPNKAS